MRFLALMSGLLLLSACSTTEEELVPTVIHSTHQTDAAPTEQRDVSKIPDATPSYVKRTRAGNKSPYTVFGKTYILLGDSAGYRERGGASWYGTKFHGRRTANGEVYDMWAMTAAHKTLPIPSYVRVTNLKNGKSVVVLVNDRGPFHGKRIIDLSYAAAIKLGFAEQGVTDVEVVDVTPVKDQSAVSLSSPVEVYPSSVPAVVPVETKKTAPTIAGKTSNPASHTQTPSQYLQVAAFRDEAKAKALRAKLSNVLNVSVKVEPNADGSWHRVRVGPIVNTLSMAETRQLLSEQGIAKPTLIK